MLKRILILLIVVLSAGAATLWAIAAPSELPYTAFEGLSDPDVANGQRIFAAGGCASCHSLEAAGEEGDDDAPPTLGGGHVISSQFGDFRVPNISPSDAGIGDWTFRHFADAMLSGVAPDGTHYYPAFPYSSYALMDIEDVNDLWGYLRTLPASDNMVAAHDVPFPFNVNRAIGLWKYLYMPEPNRVTLESADPMLARGQYLVEAVGHCGECHTPRDVLGGLETDRWLAGAPNPSGEGRIPNITPGGDIGEWSVEDLAYYFESGFTPDFDSVGGSMADVQRGLAQLPEEDRAAIAAYLKAIPAR
ncbi:cytochrome c [Pararhizobium haloflavum]|uniref:cytochrome c n=1 Tax=Pararhizobium haloflavum TaxID=2037914 RepID=UPI000C1774F9|nr:cytochrome c [Pararhizobium haloflavum]